ncbi:MAG: hypothetical protein M5U26_00410 [Planctomycetota bacterium]|nr:hypothetical protein [Planctomycetota bacterium]
MRSRISCILVLTVLANAAAPLPGGEAGAEPEYSLHEWGVFTVPRNEAWAQRDMRAEWADLPGFFYAMWPKEKLPYRGPVRKPVIFFHAEKPLGIRLGIRFAEGRPLVWWPATNMPALRNGPVQPDRLDFGLRLVHPDPDQAGQPHGCIPPEVPKGHWVETLRAVRAANHFSSPGSSRMAIRGPQAMLCDNFLYYDGLMKAPATPGAARDGARVVLTTRYTHACHDLLVLERDRDGLRIAKGWIETVAAGEQATAAEMGAALTGEAETAAIARLGDELAARLQKAGLNADEARSLVTLWEAGLFRRQGLLVCYRVPQETYEAWLPLTAEPAPKETVRVGLVVHEHLEPELDARVEALLKDLASEVFETRDAALKALRAYGGAAFPALEKHVADPDPEIAKSCRDLLAALDALPALKTEPDPKNRLSRGGARPGDESHVTLAPTAGPLRPDPERRLRRGAGARLRTPRVGRLPRPAQLGLGDARAARGMGDLPEVLPPRLARREPPLLRAGQQARRLAPRAQALPRGTEDPFRHGPAAGLVAGRGLARPRHRGGPAGHPAFPSWRRAPQPEGAQGRARNRSARSARRALDGDAPPRRLHRRVRSRG